MIQRRWAAPLVLVLFSMPLAAQAGPIERACLASGRNGATPALCDCLDHVAKSELSRSDRRRAAKFFKDPQKAQDTRQSDRPKDEAFWKRYQSYSKRAAATCD